MNTWIESFSKVYAFFLNWFMKDNDNLQTFHKQFLSIDTGYFCSPSTQDSFRGLYLSVNKEGKFPHQALLTLYETYSLAYIIGWCTDLVLRVNMKHRRQQKRPIKPDSSLARHLSCWDSKQYLTWPPCRTTWSSEYSFPAEERIFMLSGDLQSLVPEWQVIYIA